MPCHGLRQKALPSRGAPVAAGRCYARWRCIRARAEHTVGQPRLVCVPVGARGSGGRRSTLLGRTGLCLLARPGPGVLVGLGGAPSFQPKSGFRLEEEFVHFVSTFYRFEFFRAKIDFNFLKGKNINVQLMHDLHNLFAFGLRVETSAIKRCYAPCG